MRGSAQFYCWMCCGSVEQQRRTHRLQGAERAELRGRAGARWPLAAPAGELWVGAGCSALFQPQDDDDDRLWRYHSPRPCRLCHHREPLQLRRRGSLLRHRSHRDDRTAIACAAQSDRCRRRLGSGSGVLLRLLSGKAGMRVIDVSQIDGNIRKVIDRCAAAPNITVPQTFRQALTRRRQSPDWLDP
jgi:hypothetical protein